MKTCVFSCFVIVLVCSQVLALEYTLVCLKETAYTERAELRSSDLQKSIAGAAVKFTRGSYWPVVAVEGVYQRKIESPETQSLIRDNLYGGVRLVFPFFEGGLRAAEVQEAVAKKRQADYTFEDIKKSVTVEVETAYLDFLTQKGTLKSLEDQLVFIRMIKYLRRRPIM